MNTADVDVNEAFQRQVILSALFAALLLVLMSIGYWFWCDKPGRYVATFLLQYLLLLVVAAFLGGAKVMALPRKWYLQTLILCVYVLPFQMSLFWAMLGWPEHYAWAIHLFELGLAILICWGIHWLLVEGGRAQFFRATYVAVSAVLGTLIVVFLSPAAMLVGGLILMGQMPLLREEAVVPPDSAPIEIVHFSDLHLTGSSAGVTNEGNPPGDRYIDKFVAAISDTQPRLILVTGDITDAGAPEQWRTAERYLLPLSRKIPMLVAPGNHDLGTAYSDSTRKGINEVSVQRGAYLLAASNLNPHLVTARGQSLRTLLEGAQPTQEQITREQIRLKATYSQAVLDLLPLDGKNSAGRIIASKQIADREYTEERVRALLVGDAVSEAWLHIFPLQWHSADGGYLFFILNSSMRWNPQLGRSATGSFGAQQLDSLEKLLAQTAVDRKARLIGILTHHPPARPPGAWNDIRTIYEFSVLRGHPMESVRLLDLLLAAKEKKDSRSSWFVFYGHRHRHSLASHYGLTMVEAPDLTPRLGEKRDNGLWVISHNEKGYQATWKSVN